MGRSISMVLNDSNPIPNDDDENQSIQLDKRRFGLTLSSRRRWTGLKRRGPLFG
jgi:hypothetical protein